MDMNAFMASFTAARESRLIARVDGPKALGELLRRGWDARVAA